MAGDVDKIIILRGQKCASAAAAGTAGVGKVGEGARDPPKWKEVSIGNRVERRPGTGTGTDWRRYGQPQPGDGTGRQGACNRRASCLNGLSKLLSLTWEETESPSPLKAATVRWKSQLASSASVLSLSARTLTQIHPRNLSGVCSGWDVCTYRCMQR